MERRTGRVSVAVLGLGILASALMGCGRSWSGDDSGALPESIDELVSVGGPDGQQATAVEVLGCGDDAEMPMGIATFDHEGPSDRDVDALNAEWEAVSDWYHTRWKDLGWRTRGDGAVAIKEVDGKRLRASVDAVTSEHYSVVVVRDDAVMCS